MLDSGHNQGLCLKHKTCYIYADNERENKKELKRYQEKKPLILLNKCIVITMLQVTLCQQNICKQQKMNKSLNANPFCKMATACKSYLHNRTIDLLLHSFNVPCEGTELLFFLKLTNSYTQQTEIKRKAWWRMSEHPQVFNYS